jgi:uncharacterized phiE125 gp8 family phage protein
MLDLELRILMIQLRPVRTVAPAKLPVSLEEAKKHLRYDDDDEDMLIESLIAAATANLDGYEGKLGRCLITQKWKINLPEWPCYSHGPGIATPMVERTGRMTRLPLAPVTAIDSVKYYGTANVQQTLASGGYALLEDVMSPYVRWLTGLNIAPLPSLFDRDDAVEIIFTAGYGELTTDVPADIKAAILECVATAFENRESIVVGESVAELPYSAAQHIDGYRRVGF